MGICCMSQESQIGALYQSKEVEWEGCMPMADLC